MSEISRLRYVITNLVDEDTLIGTSTEDSVYPMENLYNGRPSKPLRFITDGAVGTPEWICVDLGSKMKITFVGIFNHNLSTLQVAGDELRLKGCDQGCESGGCDWDNPGDEIDLSGGVLDIPNLRTFENTHLITKLRRQHLRFDFIDQNNPDFYVEVGELFVGNWEKFSSTCYLQGGRPDSPMFFTGDQRTYMGQDWLNYYSDAKEFTLTFKNISTPQEMDEIEIFLKRVKRNGGIFVVIPDILEPWVYYVTIPTTDQFGDRLLYGEAGELKTWRIPLKTLTTGVKLL